MRVDFGSLEWRDRALPGEVFDGGEAVTFASQLGVRFPAPYLPLVSEMMGRSAVWASLDVGPVHATPGCVLGFVAGCTEEPLSHMGTVPYWHLLLREEHGFSERFVPFMAGPGR